MASRKDSKGRVLQKGEAQRKDGRYHFAYTNIAGKRCFIYADSLLELRQKEREHHVADWQGATQYGTQASLNFMFDRSLALKIGIKPSTYASYRQSYDNHVREEFGRQAVKNFNYSDIQAFYSYLMKSKGLAMSTIEHIHLQIYSALKLALQDGMILKNPADGAFGDFKRAVGDDERKIRALTMDEQKEFLEYIDGHPVWGRYHSIFQVMLGTGLRVGELCAMTWDYIDMAAKTMRIGRTMQRIRSNTGGGKKTEVKIFEPKSIHSLRTIPLPNCLIPLFMSYHVPGAYLLTGKTDKYVEPRILHNRFKKILDSCDIRDASFHACRHSFATRCIELGFDVKSLSEILGHSNVAFTMNRYVHPSMAHKAENMNMLNDLFK